MLPIIKEVKHNPENKSPLLNKDRWEASEIGLAPQKVHASYYLDFSNLTLPWIKQAAKRFVLLQAATKSFATCKSYIQSLVRLVDYLKAENLGLKPEELQRVVILGFLQYLITKKFSVATRSITLANVRNFHQVAIMEEWLPCLAKPIIFDTDFPKRSAPLPRYIPDFVVTQLVSKLHHLAEYMQRFIIILMETGRRISEICTLPVDCLEQDSQDDWFMRVCEYKMKRIRLIPVSAKCVEAIHEQQKYLNDTKPKQHFLFPTRCVNKTPHLSARFVNQKLAEISVNHEIKDINGKLWHFSSHQFRHTLGTKMINTGVPQIMVQHYLGHETSEMTSRYAHIHNETMKKAFMEYQGKLINIRGESKGLNDTHEAQWLKINITSQSLPNGLCALPMAQQRCPHANACLTCANFRTSPKYLPQHKQQLQETTTIIEQATKNGWQRVVEANTAVAANLKSIICTLEE